MSTVEPDAELVQEVEATLAHLNLNDDLTLFYTVEALSELSNVLGGAMRDHIERALTRLEQLEDSPGDMREFAGAFCGDTHLRFQRWLRDHDIPLVNWWTVHSTGHVLRWTIEAAA